MDELRHLRTQSLVEKVDKGKAVWFDSGVRWEADPSTLENQGSK